MDDNRYNESRPHFTGYSLAHGNYIDLRLWRPQSEFWKYHISIYKARTGADLFPAALFTQLFRDRIDIIKLPESYHLRRETVENLSFIFLSDATNKENESWRDLPLNGNFRRAEKQMAKYLDKLQDKFRKEHPHGNQ